MPKIDVDDEVFALLQQLATPFLDTPNSVLRRELLGAGTESGVGSSAGQAAQTIQSRHRRTGDLMSLITSGKVEPDDVLIYVKRNGERYRGVVTNDGWIRVNGNTYASPSGALKADLGYDVNGWKTWTHQRSGQLLDAFRN